MAKSQSDGSCKVLPSTFISLSAYDKVGLPPHQAEDTSSNANEIGVGSLTLRLLPDVKETQPPGGTAPC